MEEYKDLIPGWIVWVLLIVIAVPSQNDVLMALAGFFPFWAGALWLAFILIREKIADRRQKKALRRSDAISIVTQYPQATKAYFEKNFGVVKEFISEDDLTDARISSLLCESKYRWHNEEMSLSPIYWDKVEDKRKSEERQKEWRQSVEQKKEQEKQAFIESLPSHIESWCTRNGLKHKYFKDYEYRSYRSGSYWVDLSDPWGNDYSNIVQDFLSESNYSRAFSEAAEMIVNALRETFGDGTKYLTLVCLPVGSIKKTKQIYSDFAELICSKLSIRNGCRYIKIVEGERVLLFSRKDPRKEYAYSSFRNSYVILFDVVWRANGARLENEKQQLEALGATVVGAITIGKTPSYRKVSHEGGKVYYVLEDSKI